MFFRHLDLYLINDNSSLLFCLFPFLGFFSNECPIFVNSTHYRNCKMENDNLKIQLDSIRRILSYCITQTYNVLIGNILRKKGYINSIQFKEILQKEYIRIIDELIFHLFDSSYSCMCRGILQR